MARKKPQNYIDKKEMYDALLAYKRECNSAEESGEEVPPIPNYLGKCFLDISEGLGRRPNFSNYPFKDDMVLDGVENCIKALNNFDPEKGSNPFGYFSRIAWFAFLRRIAAEKKQLYIKYKVTERTGMLGGMSDNKDNHSVYSDFSTENMEHFVENWEEKNIK